MKMEQSEQSLKLSIGKKWKAMALICAAVSVLIVIGVLVAPMLKIMTFSEEEKYLYEGIKAVQKNLLNENSIQIKEAYVVINKEGELDKEREGIKVIVVLAYTAQNRGGGYSDDVVVYYEAEDGYKTVYEDLSDITSDETVSVEERAKAAGRNAIYKHFFLICLTYGDVYTQESIDKVMQAI